MRHIVVSSADIFTDRDLAAFIANILAGTEFQDSATDAAIKLAAALIGNGWVSVIRIDPAPAPS